MSLNNLRVIVTVIVTIFIGALLGWSYYHGGVPSHHILNRKDLPAISNGWGILLLPCLSWFLMGSIKNRIGKASGVNFADSNSLARICWLFLGGLVLGLLLAISFSYDFKPFLDNVLYLLLILSLLVPIYYAEFILGFVLGMTFTFGAMLPTVFILILAGIGWLLFRFVRPLIIRLIGYFRK